MIGSLDLVKSTGGLRDVGFVLWCAVGDCCVTEPPDISIVFCVVELSLNGYNAKQH